MFGKIKGKLGDIFKKNEEHIEEHAVEVIEEDIPKPSNEVVSDGEEIQTEIKEEKKGFLGGLFSKKKDVEQDLGEELTEEVQDAVLEHVDEKEKEEIQSGKDLTKDEIKEHKKELDVAIEKEEVQEIKTNEDIPKFEENKVEIALEKQHELEENLPAPLPVLDEVQEEPNEEKNEKKSFMGGLFSKKKKEEEVEESLEELPLPEIAKEDSIIDKPSIEEVSNDEGNGFFSKALNVVKKKKITDEDYDKIWMDLEIFLLEINVAYEIVEKINLALRETLIGNSYDRFGLSKTIREVMVSNVQVILKGREGNFLDEITKVKKTSDGAHEPLKIMMLGVNGTGKTTSIGKIIKFLQNQNLSVVVAAADTFRAAAVDQIAKHCENLGVKCIQHQNGGDPAAVAFDAVEHAKAKGIDVVLIDTAGRMPNNSNLMLELQKIKRVSKSQMALFIGDSISGNDLIDQITLFDKGVEINGVVLTKVDTDERPGSIVTCAYSIEKPIYFLGIGQGYDDLITFDAKLVAEKLFDIEE